MSKLPGVEESDRRAGSPDLCQIIPADANGPDRTLATRYKAAAQFHQTGHSFITQHFHMPDGCREDKAAARSIYKTY